MNPKMLQQMMIAAHRANKPERQFTLGMLIDALDGIPTKTETTVKYDFADTFPTTFDSYRGYYEDLALGYGRSGYWAPENDAEPPSIAELLERCRAADGATFTGWKGGDFLMERRTTIWVANPGNTGGTAIVGVDDLGYEVVLRTEMID